MHCLGTTELFPNKEASPRHHICICTSKLAPCRARAGLPTEETALSALFSIKAQWPLPVRTTEGHQWRRKGRKGLSGREPHSRDPSSEKGLNVDLQRGAGHGQLKSGDHVRMKDPQLPNALAPDKDLGTSPGEESGTCKTEREKNQVSPGKNANGHLTLKAHSSPPKMTILL